MKHAAKLLTRTSDHHTSEAQLLKTVDIL